MTLDNVMRLDFFIVLLILFVIAKILKMSQQLDNLTKAVTDLTTVAESAIGLINNLKTELDAAIAANAAGDDGVALDALSATLGAEKEKLAAAITANTPATPGSGESA